MTRLRNRQSGVSTVRWPLSGHCESEIVGYQDGARLLPDGGLGEQARMLGAAPLEVQMQLGQQR